MGISYLPSPVALVVPALDPTGTGLAPSIGATKPMSAPSERSPVLTRSLEQVSFTPRNVLADYDPARAALLQGPKGDILMPTSAGMVDLGAHKLTFDAASMQGHISPALGKGMMDTLDLVLQGAPISFTGADLMIMLEVDTGALPSAPPQMVKQLMECTTITVSVHRVKSPVRAAGYINPKGFARGTRTIAGTMVLTQFTCDVLMRFLRSSLLAGDKSKSDWYSKTDQLPPLNLTLFFCNEQGFASYRRLLGVELYTDGIVYSHNDLMSEQTITYMASDFTPLLPLTVSSLWDTSPGQRQQNLTPGDLMKSSTVLL